MSMASQAAVWVSRRAWSWVVRSGSQVVASSRPVMALMDAWKCSATIFIGMLQAVRRVRRVEASMPLSKWGSAWCTSRVTERFRQRRMSRLLLLSAVRLGQSSDFRRALRRRAVTYQRSVIKAIVGWQRRGCADEVRRRHPSEVRTREVSLIDVGPGEVRARQIGIGEVHEDE